MERDGLVVWGKALYQPQDDATHRLSFVKSSAQLTHVVVARDCLLALTSDGDIRKVSRDTPEFVLLGRLPSPLLAAVDEEVSVSRGLGSYVTSDGKLTVADCEGLRGVDGSFTSSVMLEGGEGVAVTSRGVVQSTRDGGRTWTELGLGKDVALSVRTEAHGAVSVNTARGTRRYHDGELHELIIPQQRKSGELYQELGNIYDSLRQAGLRTLLDGSLPDWREGRALVRHELVRTAELELWLDGSDVVEEMQGAAPVRHKGALPAEDCELWSWGARVIAACPTAFDRKLYIWNGQSFNEGPTGPFADRVAPYLSDDGIHIVLKRSCEQVETVLAGAAALPDDGRCVYNTQTRRLSAVPADQTFLGIAGSAVLTTDEKAYTVKDGEWVKSIDAPSGSSIVKAVIGPHRSVLFALESGEDAPKRELALWRDGEWSRAPSPGALTALVARGRGRFLAQADYKLWHVRVDGSTLDVQVIPSPSGSATWTTREPLDFCEGEVCLLRDGVRLEGDPPFEIVGDKTSSFSDEPLGAVEPVPTDKKIWFDCSEPPGQEPYDKTIQKRAKDVELTPGPAAWQLAWWNPEGRKIASKKSTWRPPDTLAAFDRVRMTIVWALESGALTKAVLDDAQRMVWLPRKGPAVTFEAQELRAVLSLADSSTVLWMESFAGAAYLARVTASGAVSWSRFARTGSLRNSADAQLAVVDGTVGWLFGQKDFVPADGTLPRRTLTDVAPSSTMPPPAVCTHPTTRVGTAVAYEAFTMGPDVSGKDCSTTIVKADEGWCVQSLACFAEGSNRRALRARLEGGTLSGSYGVWGGWESERVQPVNCKPR